MKILHQCYPCLLQHINNLIENLKLDDEQAQNVLDTTLTLILHRKESDTTQHIVRGIYDYIHHSYFPKQDDFDPYREIKNESNRLVATALPAFRRMLQGAEDPLRLAVRGAAAGNIIDYGAAAGHTINIEDEIQKIPSLEFGCEHIAAFRTAVQKANSILYLADNAGEIIFDSLLIEQIAQANPKAAIYLAVREKPIINDVTISDAKALVAGGNLQLPECARLISSGSPYPGTVLTECTPEFQQLFANAGLVISKGQGNYETLCETIHPSLFYILRVKCEPVARQTGIEKGKLILMQS